MNTAMLRAIADAADALSRLARAAIENAPDATAPTLLLPLALAAREAGTSTRVLRDAIRCGELPAFGKQRDRAVRRADLAKWIEGRRVRPIAGIADADMDRRIQRIASARKATR